MNRSVVTLSPSNARTRAPLNQCAQRLGQKLAVNVSRSIIPMIDFRTSTGITAQSNSPENTSSYSRIKSSFLTVRIDSKSTHPWPNVFEITADHHSHPKRLIFHINQCCTCQSICNDKGRRKPVCLRIWMNSTSKFLFPVQMMSKPHF